MSRHRGEFSDFDWYCDKCGAYLNDQRGFDGEYGIFICKECGAGNYISATNIVDLDFHIKVDDDD